mgnify:FL=1
MASSFDDLRVEDAKNSEVKSTAAAEKIATEAKLNGPSRGQYEGREVVGKGTPIAPYFGIYRWRPFVEWFCSIADRVEPGEDVIEARAKFTLKHKCYFQVAMFLDLFLEMVIVMLMIIAITLLALRALGFDLPGCLSG